MSIPKIVDGPALAFIPGQGWVTVYPDGRTVRCPDQSCPAMDGSPVDQKIKAVQAK